VGVAPSVALGCAIIRPRQRSPRNPGDRSLHLNIFHEYASTLRGLIEQKEIS
jgi:hypothetical protein